MTSKILLTLSTVTCLALLAGCKTNTSDCDACDAPDPAISKVVETAPCMKALDRFTAADVPALGPSETEVAAGHWTTNASPAPANLPGHGMAEHPMLYIGEGYNKMFVVDKGKVIWTYSTGKGNEYDDAWMLSNGNILFTRMQYLAEVTPEKKIVWRYDCPTNTEVHCCQPIGLDKVLFIQNGLPPRLKVINIKTGKVEVEHDLPARSLKDQKTVHPQFRRVRYTADGHYLVPMLGLGTNGAVVEYDKNFKEVWRYNIRSPWAAIRLKNGNTLITDEGDKLTREVNPKGETVWEVRSEDLPEPYRFINTQSCTRLANGNTIICSRGGSGKGPATGGSHAGQESGVGIVGLVRARTRNGGSGPGRSGNSGAARAVGALRSAGLPTGKSLRILLTRRSGDRRSIRIMAASYDLKIRMI